MLLPIRLAVWTTAIVFAAVPCRADLVGTHVTGVITFPGLSGNFYDPTLYSGIFVPTGTLNKTQGANVTISAAATEFGYSDGANTITADFSGTQLRLTDISTGSSGWTQTFTDTSFAGMSLVSSNFGGLTFSSNQDILKFGWGGPGALAQPRTFSAVFNITDPPPTPEPSSIPLLMVGLGAAVMLARRRIAASPPVSNG